MNYRTEDEVRDSAKLILGFDRTEPKVKQGTGQITTFNQLGFKGVIDKPDGWYLPDDKGIPAIILETKSEAEDISLQKWAKELIKNCNIALTQYKHVVGILYNGKTVRIFLDNIEAESTAPTLQDKSYYLTLFTKNTIDKQQIYTLTKRINDCLHFDFGIKNLYHRMIFTACALVGKRYGALLVKGMAFTLMKNSILSTLSKSLEESRKQNLKLDLLIEVYSEIKMNNTTNQDAIDNFIEWIAEISDCVNSDFWNGEDVMGIFFNEFNRYKKKSDSGQVFTPDHITSFMYRLIDVDKDDRVLDAACGSGAFLVKAMCNMVKEAGGVKTKKAATIKDVQLYGIEFDREIFALACANMLIHKDGKTNLEQLDSRTQEACDWIKSKNIKKVLMNPPFESKYGCLVIVDNVLRSVPKGTKCAFIMPDKKLEKDRKGKKLLEHSTLQKIIKLPEKVFSEGVTTSIFIFEAGVPQKGREIFACYIEDDGLETVKNQGRQDTKDRWSAIEDAWVDIIRKQSGHSSIQWLKPTEYLSYQMPKKEFSVHNEDFSKAVMDYLIFLQGIEYQAFNEAIVKKFLYCSKVQVVDGNTSLVLTGSNSQANTSSSQDETSIPEIKIDTWRNFQLSELFDVVKGSRLTKAEMRDGTTRYIGASSFNNGITTYISNSEHIHPGNTLTVCYNGSDMPQLYFDQTGVQLFVCGAKPEFDYITGKFGYPSGVVQYTGFARYDTLHDAQTKNRILIMPTWRMYITDENSFLESAYYRQWNQLLTDSRLAEYLEKKELSVIFYPHCEVQKYLHLFRTGSDRIILADFANYDVQTLLKESKLLVTDYSSVFFDFAYMRKPVVYFQFDQDEFFSRHYNRGYFSYQKMGFGPVTESVESTVEAIIQCADGGFCPADEYAQRMQMFFPLYDQKNCERIYEAICLL